MEENPRKPNNKQSTMWHTSAARHVNNLALSLATTILLIIFWILCNCEIGFPNAFLSNAYFTAQSIEADAIPNACPATPILPPSKVCMAILNPCPSSPIRLDLGILTLSIMRFAVEDARMPSLSSFAPREKPGASVGTTNAEMPLCLLSFRVHTS